MAVHSLYFKNAVPTGASTALSLQDGGTAPTGALTTTGWTVAKLASPNLSAMLCRTKRASTTFATSDAIGSFAASASFRSETTFSGTFANTDWTLAFRVRASTAASAQTGAIKVRIWKSTAADGTGATQLTSAVLTGTTTAALSTSASATSTVTWSPGATVTLSNEYLWVQCEWSVVVASGSTTGDAVIYVESAGVITTPDLPIAGTMASTEAGDIASASGAVTTVPSPVKLLLHFDGADASKTFADSSQSSHALTAHGTAQIDTAQQEFGSASGYFIDANDYLGLDNATDFTFGTGDFTIESWLRRETTAVPVVLMDFRSSSDLMPPFVYYDAGALRYYCNGADRITYATSLAVGAWNHVAVTRSGANTRLFLNGAQVGSTYVATDNLTCASGGPSIGATWQADVTAWEAAVVAAGGTVSGGRETLITNLIGGLKLDNVWSKLDRLWVLAPENQPSGLIDLVARDAATAVSSPAFTIDRGFTGDGATSYINTNFNPVTDGINYQQNSACGGVWDITNSSANDRVMVGSSNGSAYGLDGSIQYLDGNGYWRINSDSAAASLVAPYPGPGLFMANRSGAGAIQLYQNGSSITTAAAASATIPNLDIFLLARNTNGSFGFNNGSDTIAAAVFGGSLNATDHSNLYSRLRTYMTAIGVP